MFLTRLNEYVSWRTVLKIDRFHGNTNGATLCKLPYLSISGQMLKLTSAKGQNNAKSRIIEWTCSLRPHLTVLDNNHTRRLRPMITRFEIKQQIPA